MSGNLVRFQSSHQELLLTDDIHDDLRDSSADPYNAFNNSRTETTQGRRREKAENTEPKLPLNNETNDKEKSVNDGGKNESGTRESEEDNVIKEGESSTSPNENETENRSEDSGKENESNNNDSQKKKVWKDIGKFALTTVIVGGTAIALPVIGFGALGPAVSSLAGTYQSAVLSTIASGSVLATLQTFVGGSAATSAAYTDNGKFKQKEKDAKDNGVKNNEKKGKKEEDSGEKEDNKRKECGKEKDNEEKENEKKDIKDSECKKDNEEKHNREKKDNKEKVKQNG